MIKKIGAVEQIQAKLKNRAFAKDRPTKPGECRQGLPLLHTKDEPHSFRFVRGDRYGCCARCGAEILT